MTWAEQWSIKIDGTELNDRVQYITQCPEIENSSEDDVVLVPVDGRAPAYIRNQPKEIIYTLLIAVIDAHDWATWHTRITALDALLTKNTPHTLSVQVRGMDTPRTTPVIVRGRTGVAPKERRMVYTLVVPVPITL